MSKNPIIELLDPVPDYSDFDAVPDLPQREDASVVLLREIRDLLAREHDPTMLGPLTSWRSIAAAIGVSHDTITRRRREREDNSEPYFATPEDARVWWSNLLAPPPKMSTRARKVERAVGMTLADMKSRRGR